MTQDLYCIKHEEMVIPEGACCIGHEYIANGHGDIPGLQFREFCDFPDGYATMPPPDMEEDWIEHVVEPAPVLAFQGVDIDDDEADELRDMTFDGLDRYESL